MKEQMNIKNVPGTFSRIDRYENETVNILGVLKYPEKGMSPEYTLYLVETKYGEKLRLYGWELEELE